MVGLWCKFDDVVVGVVVDYLYGGIFFCSGIWFCCFLGGVSFVGFKGFVLYILFFCLCGVYWLEVDVY